MAEEMNQNVQPQGWKDVQLTPDMSVSMLINFLNVLNQRLSNLEDIIEITAEDGRKMTLTEYYNLQVQSHNESTETKGE